MSYSEERFYQGQPGTVEGTLWTVPSTMNNLNVKRVIVKEIVLANTSSSQQTVSLSIVPSGGTAGNANRIVPTITLTNNSVTRLGLSEVMYVGDFLSGLQGLSGAVTVTASGVVRS